jgi:hypothetical protein
LLSIVVVAAAAAVLVAAAVVVVDVVVIALSCVNELPECQRQLVQEGCIMHLHTSGSDHGFWDYSKHCV